MSIKRAFNEDDEADEETPNYGAVQKRTKISHQNALEEDFTIFDYDEIYDSIKAREYSMQQSKKGDKKTVLNN